VRAQHQHHMVLSDGRVVFLDGPVRAVPKGGSTTTAPLPLEVSRHGLPLGEVLGLMQLVNANIGSKPGAQCSFFNGWALTLH
jgi:hypothetical protein